jgi:hypothetical protein
MEAVFCLSMGSFEVEETQIELAKLSVRDLETLDEYFRNGYNATKAYLSTHPDSSYNAARSSAADFLARPNVRAEIERRLAEKHMSAEEAIERITNIGRGDLGLFYKVVDEWMFNPLSSYEILDEKEVIDDTDPEKPVKRISYRVRHVALDMDKVMDPQYSPLIKEFTDDGRKLSIKLHSSHEAQRDILKLHGKLGEKARRENTPPGEISGSPEALLALVRAFEADKAAAIDRARAVDADSTDIRNE